MICEIVVGVCDEYIIGGWHVMCILVVGGM